MHKRKEQRRINHLRRVFSVWEQAFPVALLLPPKEEVESIEQKTAWSLLLLKRSQSSMAMIQLRKVKMS